MVFCAKGAEARCETCPITNDSASTCKFAVEFQPIIHAHWIANGVHPHNGVVGNWKCSHCKRISLENSEYCHRCGARMDEEEE